MITAQFLICLFAQISKNTQFLLNFLALTGIIPYILSVQREQTEYFLSSFGMTYRFRPGIVNTIYTAYFIIVAVNILFYAMDVLNKTRINVANMSEFIYNSLAMPVLVFDDKYRLCIANEAASEFLVLPKEKDRLKDYRIESLFTLNNSSIFDFENPHYSYDAVCQVNNAPCALTISKIKDSYGDIIGYIVNIQDLSERMQYIEELKKARQEADSSNIVKSRFLASMSHEIRTPMNAIIGFSELALKENPSPTLTDYLEDIKSSSHNLMALINDILDISKIESGKMTLVNVTYNTAELLHDIYEMIRTQASKKGLDFKIQIDPKLPAVLYGDANRLKNILINLLNNAIKYTLSGFIKLEIICSDPLRTPFTMEIRVSDSGIGIKEEDKLSLFEAFTQVDQQKNYGKEGTGLGLTLVKNYCILMNGSIYVESVYGEGSTFIATVEQSVTDTSPIDLNLILSHHRKDEFSLGALHVHGVETLIVDDNPINCKVISRSMEYYGMNVDIASSGLEAVSMYRGKHYDMIFMDQMMPEMDGVESMKRIHKLNDYYATSEHCKIIALTANAISGVRDELLAEGFDEYLSKPINFRDLEALLLTFLPQSAFEHIPPHMNMEYSYEKISETTLSSMLPEVNVHKGINYCGGTLDDYLEVIQIMYTESDSRINTLINNFESENWKDFTINIHALKSSCFSIGANDCGETAKSLEMAGRNGDISYIRSNLQPFIEKYKILLQKFENILSRWRNADSSIQLADILKEFKKSIKNYDFAHAAALLRKAHSASDSEEDTDLLNTLDILMDNLDIDKILSLL